MGIIHLHELPPHVPLDGVSMMLYSYIQYMGILHLHELPPHVPLYNVSMMLYSYIQYIGILDFALLYIYS